MSAHTKANKADTAECRQPLPCKPFVKWVGGKSQLLAEIARSLPPDIETAIDTYIEPFAGGGAVLFWMLQRYPTIKHAVINDLNSKLINVYRCIRDNPEEIIRQLLELQRQYLPLSHQERATMYALCRARFNRHPTEDTEQAALFIFLNRTCYNGLYRENASGLFNVPHGRYTHPNICDADTIRADAVLLQRVEIMAGDYSKTAVYATPRVLYYLDPPYRPLSATSSFNSYVKERFDDNEQIRLKKFCDTISERGGRFLLSNSDPKNTGEDTFFDDLYSSFNIKRVHATRMVNAKAERRGSISELLITNTHGYNTENMGSKAKPSFDLFLSQLTDTNTTLGSLTDFDECNANVRKIAVKLNQLNYLVGKADIATAVHEIWEENHKAFDVLDILVAVRQGEKNILDNHGMLRTMRSYFDTENDVVDFLRQTGLACVLQNKQITNLVDYVFGVEVGLDTNARKNRGGKLFEYVIENILKSHGLKYRKEVYSSEFPIVNTVLGEDKKRFDFAIEVNNKTYLLEVNYYNCGGSKPNEVARAYTELSSKVNSCVGFEFVWVTDGKGWRAAKNKLEEGYLSIPNLYNITTFKRFIERLSAE